MLFGKLPTWQDKCGDATNVPESVMSMIEGLRTPVSITPQASPVSQRHSRVRRQNHSFINHLENNLLIRISIYF